MPPIKPIKFLPILKTSLWGGNDIKTLKGLPDTALQIGESWEISDVPGFESTVAEGDDLGYTFARLLERYGARLVGKKNLETYGDRFPLLVKFISADKDLSVQVHPDDEMAQRIGHRFGKSEMWYVVKANEDAKIYSGFRVPFSPEKLDEILSDHSICDYLCEHDTAAGDCFFVPAGRIHSIGGGNLLIEVQQTSDDTFRVYDYDRTDRHGKKRELHIDLAREALHYDFAEDFRTPYALTPNAPTLLVDCPEFTVRLHRADKPVCVDYGTLDSFVIFVAFQGSARLLDGQGHTISLKAGETVLFPAENRSVEILPDSHSDFGAIEAFIR